jgi:ribosomal protein S18 acetylase RimI-like enzyme
MSSVPAMPLRRSPGGLRSDDAVKLALPPLLMRRATIDDAQELAAFAARVFMETFGDENSPDDLRDHVESTYGVAQQSEEIRDANTATWLVEHDDGTLIGYAQLCRKRVPPCVTGANPIEIYRFYVARAAQGTGVAQALMSTAFSQAREWGADVVWLGVWEHNPRAMRFYRKFGFSDVGSIDFFVGPDRQTDRVYVVPLPDDLSQTGRDA